MIEGREPGEVIKHDDTKKGMAWAVMFGKTIALWGTRKGCVMRAMAMEDDSALHHVDRKGLPESRNVRRLERRGKLASPMPLASITTDSPIGYLLAVERAYMERKKVIAREPSYYDVSSNSITIAELLQLGVSRQDLAMNVKSIYLNRREWGGHARKYRILSFCRTDITRYALVIARFEAEFAKMTDEQVMAFKYPKAKMMEPDNSIIGKRMTMCLSPTTETIKALLLDGESDSILLMKCSTANSKFGLELAVTMIKRRKKFKNKVKSTWQNTFDELK
jgi:hypothetical protein